MTDTPIRIAAEKAGWSYHYSPVLNMEYAVRELKTGQEIMTADRVRYAPEELHILNRNGGLKPFPHLVKKVFSGEIVAVLST